MTYYILLFLVLCLSMEMVFYIRKMEKLQKDFHTLSEEVREKGTCPEPKETSRDSCKLRDIRPSLIVSAFSVSEPRSVSTYESKYKLHNYRKVHFNEGDDFSAEAGIFHCSKPGVYYFTASLIKKRALDDKKSEKVDFVHCKIYKNTEEVLDIFVDPTDDNTDIGSAAVSNSIVLRLKSDDKVYLGDCDDPLVSLESWSSFSGFILYPDS